MLKVAPARAATGPIASGKATMNMRGNALDRPRAADDFATIKARMAKAGERRMSFDLGALAISPGFTLRRPDADRKASFRAITQAPTS